MSDKILYVRYYERLDEAREIITKKYYDLGGEVMEADEPLEIITKLGPVWDVEQFLIDIESAADRK